MPSRRATQTLAWCAAGSAPRALLRRTMAADRLLTVVGLLTLLTLALMLLGVAFDRRAISGVPAWIKPAKFAISISIYSFSLLLLLSLVQGHRRLVAMIARLTGISLSIELAIIILQVIRGTTSHFNTETPLDAVLWAMMGGSIMPVWLMNLLAAGLLLRQRLPDATLAWSLRLGLLSSFVGMTVALPMVVNGAHSVGVADGGPGLPLVGWSTEGGDLRVGHFIGLHGLQVLPLLGWLLSLMPARLRSGHRLALLWTAALGYLGTTLLATWQALRGQPLITPDDLTLTAFMVLAGTVIVAALLVLLHARISPTPIPVRRSAAGYA